jgi:hypothetical protein
MAPAVTMTSLWVSAVDLNVLCGALNDPRQALMSCENFLAIRSHSSLWAEKIEGDHHQRPEWRGERVAGYLRASHSEILVSWEKAVAEVQNQEI